VPRLSDTEREALTAGTIDGSDIDVAFDDLLIVGPEATDE
jgi:hypothetical protein